MWRHSSYWVLQIWNRWTPPYCHNSCMELSYVSRKNISILSAKWMLSEYIGSWIDYHSNNIQAIKSSQKYANHSHAKPIPKPWHLQTRLLTMLHLLTKKIEITILNHSPQSTTILWATLTPNPSLNCALINLIYLHNHSLIY